MILSNLLNGSIIFVYEQNLSMKRLLFSIFAVAILYLVSALSAKAEVSCQPIYGGGQTCIQVSQVAINKTVENPQTGAFVDNLGINDPRYSPSSTVTFRIIVTNTGNTDTSKVTVKDIFPQFINFVSGPGSFDANTKTLSFEVDNLSAGASTTFTVSGKTADANQFPNSQGITCVVNQAIATANNGQQSSDNSQFCIEKPVLGVTKGGLKVLPAPSIAETPATGPEMLPLIGLIPTGLIGLILKKKSKITFQGGEK